jgi:ABC-type amino acid transport substrate-binding protein
LLIVAIIVLRPSSPMAADDEFTRDHATRQLVVGLKEAPPFVIRESDGSWEGISVDLWREVARDLQLKFRFAEEPTVQGLLDKTSAGQYDVAVAAVTVTAERAKTVDFAQPFFSTGLGIAVANDLVLSWAPVVRAVTSFGFVQAVLALVSLALITGFAVWVFERRTNADFAGGPRGLTSSVWWSTLAMTQHSHGHAGPKTLPGRIIAIIWMVTSIIALAVFTASVTSVLTTKQLQRAVNSPRDLPSVRVGTVSGTAAEQTLSRMNVAYVGYSNPLDGLNELREGKLEAFVYDKPLLAWYIRRHHPLSIKLLEMTFEPQTYAFALPNNSPLQKAISISVLRATQGDWWTEVRFRYLGPS